MSRAPVQIPLNSTLEAVVAHLCKRLGRLSTTQAVKFPYLIDIIAKHHLGTTVCRASYEAWGHGVVAREVYYGVNSSKLLTVAETKKGTGKVIRCDKESQELPAEVMEIIDYVADQYGGMPIKELGLLTKRLNPHVKKWGLNASISVSEDQYVRLAPNWQAMCRRIEKMDFNAMERDAEPALSPRALFEKILNG